MQKSRILAVLFCFIPALSVAATIELAPPIRQVFITPFVWEGMEGPVNQFQEFDFSELPHARITGPIEEGDAQKLADLMMSDISKAMSRGEFNQPLIVSFDSEGGSYQEGLALSDMIRKMNAATYVGPGDRCLSACALAWLGGEYELIRSILWQPTRFLHVDSTLGFHAPFSNEYPQGIGSLDQAGIELVADLFYGLASESIRELQKRINNWKIHPNFIFDFLGKGPNEFLNVDHADLLFRNNITLLAEQPRILRQIGSLEALSVCNYALRTMVEPAANYQNIGNFRGDGINLSNPQELIAFSKDNKPVRIEKGRDGRSRLIVEDLIAGRGPYSCSVENRGDSVRTYPYKAFDERQGE